jgi:hypothetical protein
MARAYGSSAHLLMKRETAYGQAATELRVDQRHQPSPCGR